jgi:hypothetical protein
MAYGVLNNFVRNNFIQDTSINPFCAVNGMCQFETDLSCPAYFWCVK